MADDETHIGRNNEERKEDENRRIMGKALEGVAAETVQRFGSAIKEHLAAYAGDREKPADENSRPEVPHLRMSAKSAVVPHRF